MEEPRLGELIERLGGLLRARSRRRAAEFGLQSAHLQVLDYLSRCNRFSNTAVAVGSYLQLTKGTLSQSLKLLHQRGLVTRTPDAEDRRVVRLGVTDPGREVLRACSAAGALERQLAPIDDTDRRGAAAVLLHCLRGLQREAGFDGFGQCRTCRHLRRPDPTHYRCGLTGEALQPAETLQLCQEHAWPESHQNDALEEST